MPQVHGYRRGDRSEYVDVTIGEDGSTRIVTQILDNAGESETTWDLTADQVAELRAALGDHVDAGLAPVSDDPGFSALIRAAIEALQPAPPSHSWSSVN